METTRQRIRQFIDIQGIKPKDFLDATKLKRGVLDKSLDKSGVTDSVIADILAIYSEINPLWLITGKGDMLLKDLHLEQENWIEFSNNYSSEKHSNIALLRVGLRLDEVCNYKEISHKELALILNLKYQELMQMIAGKIAVPEIVLNKIKAHFPEFNKTWLFTGKGEMLINDIIVDLEPTSNGSATNVFKLRTDNNLTHQEIPLYNIEAAAGLVELFQTPNSETAIDTLRIPNLPKCDGAVFVTGDSMYPLLKSGDIVAYKQIQDFGTEIFWGEMYLISVEVAGEEYISVKYIQQSDKGIEYIKLVSQNKHHQDKDVHIDKVRAMALVKASVRINSMG